MKNSSGNSAAILAKIAHLEALCSQDVGRGIKPLAEKASGGLLETARAIATHPQPHIAIMTGFFVPTAQPPAAETDGPLGCAHLAAGLLRAGIPVRIVTDSLCYNAVRSAVLAAGVDPEVPFDIFPVTYTEEESWQQGFQDVEEVLEIWQAAEPPLSHVIAIERAGPGVDGLVRNMRGEDITAHTAPLHLLFCQPHLVSIGIGDGGNELGMGKIPRDLIKEHILQGEEIACITPCDHLIVCGVSNWGALGLLAALALLREDWQAEILAGLTIEIELEILQALVHQGPAVDGIKRKQALSVDNLPWEIHARVLRLITDLVRGEGPFP